MPCKPEAACRLPTCRSTLRAPDENSFDVEGWSAAGAGAAVPASSSSRAADGLGSEEEDVEKAELWGSGDDQAHR